MSHRHVTIPILAFTVLLLAGCPKANQEFGQGKRAEAVQDYDTALVHYERALRDDPTNAEYKLRENRMRFQAGQFHVRQGQKALEKGDLQLALIEFQKARGIDPSSAVADQEARRTFEMIAAAEKAAQPASAPAPPEEPHLMQMPPQLKPISAERINLKMTNDARIVFDTIAKLAGLTVLFDPDFTSRRISTELPSVTLEQALDAVSLQSKAFWKPVTSNIIFVAPDQPQKRRDYEDEVVSTFYLANTLTPQDLTEVVTGLRQLLGVTHIQQVNSQNAIIIRDTPDKLAVAKKIIDDIDQARPEVVIHVTVMQIRLDRLRDLGIQPGTSATLTFTPRPALGPSTTTGTPPSGTGGTTGGTTTTTPLVTLKNLHNLDTGDYSLSLPGAALTALYTDSTTRIIQDPEIRVTDGQTAKLRIGDRVPVATGSFQAGVGVGVGTAGTGIVNPLVNTQFQYQDVGVNIDVTPRVHPNSEISLKLAVDVSSVTGTRNIGGIDQPLISQRKIEHDIRLKEGEISVLGGLIERTETKSLTGWPGLAKIPFLRYFFSGENVEHQENEVLIVLTPHIVRMASITPQNLQSLATGTDTNIRVQAAEPAMAAPTGAPPPAPAAAPPPVSTTPTPAAPAAGAAAKLRFDPANMVMKSGDTATVGLAIDGAQDLFSIPLLLQYNPAVIQVEEVRNGGFLSGGTQEIAIVQRIDPARGQAIVSATRQPNTPGINGSGSLLGFVIRAVGPGTSTLEILQVNARDSQQRPIPLVAGVATVRVQ